MQQIEGLGAGGTDQWIKVRWPPSTHHHTNSCLRGFGGGRLPRGERHVMDGGEQSVPIGIDGIDGDGSGA